MVHLASTHMWSGNCCLQLQGRALRDSDISPSLEGQRAEMFWPDDNLWYLVEINSVDMHTHQVIMIRTAACVTCRSCFCTL